MDLTGLVELANPFTILYFFGRMNIPVYITLFRILSIPVLVILLLSRFAGHELAAAIVFAAAALSDIADGVWARRSEKTSAQGALLDPMADKLLISSALICLVGLGVVPSWMAIIIVGREIAITGFRAIAISRGILISSSVLGKIKMWCEGIALTFLILGEGNLGSFYVVGQVGLWIVLAVVLLSASEYYVRFGRLVFSSSATDTTK